MPQQMQQDPAQLLAQLIAQFAQQQNGQQASQQAQPTAQPMVQAQPKEMDKNPLQVGVIKAIKEYNKNMENQGKHMAAQALHNGATPDDILGHELMAGQSEFAPPMNLQSQQQPQQDLSQFRTDDFANSKNPLIRFLTAVGFQQTPQDQVASTTAALHRQQLAGQDSTSQLQRVQARDYGERTRIERQNAETNEFQAMNQYNNALLDNALKQQELTGTEMSADAQYKVAKAKELFNKSLEGPLTPEKQVQTLRMAKKLMDEAGIKGSVGVAANGVAMINASDPNSASMQNFKDKRIEKFITTVENNNVQRQNIKAAEEAVKKLNSGIYGKISRGFAKNLDPNNPALGDWQKIKMVLTDAQLMSVARTKGAVSDREMELFAQAAANDDLTSLPRIMPVLKKILSSINAEEKGLAGSYKKIYGEDPYAWAESNSNMEEQAIKTGFEELSDEELDRRLLELEGKK